MNEQQKAFLAGLECPFEVGIKGRDIMVAALRKEVYAAIDREREYQDRKWGDNPHCLDGWLNILEKELREARAAWRMCDSRQTKQELLQVAAVVIASLEEHGLVERKCDHPSWHMYCALPGDERRIGVICLKCNTKGIVRHPSTHEYREAERALCGRMAEWLEPDRIIIPARGEVCE